MNKFFQYIMHAMGVYSTPFATMGKDPSEKGKTRLPNTFYKKRKVANRMAKKSRSINKHYAKYR